ncbi:hypothetical protein ACFYN3_41625 [Streptomyces lavendulae]|uniref:hypothetical protein n=1 Tax=Streptomyces lavendulae TaxID=1914 RepID=UPI0036B57043
MTRRTLGTGPRPTTTPEPAPLRGRLPAERAETPEPEPAAIPVTRTSATRRALGTGTR